jgi:hypothetical protein
MRLAALILAAWFAVSCIRENCDKRGELTAEFHLRDNDESFFCRISNLDIYLFDSAHRLIEIRQMGLEGEGVLRRAKFTLPPGIYYVVAWANLTSDVEVSHGHPRIEQNYVDFGSLVTARSVYYAPERTPERTDGSCVADVDYTAHRVEVRYGESVTRDFMFAPVMRTVDVFISGWRGDEPPLVELVGGSVRYDFALRADPTLRAIRREASTRTIDGREVFGAGFRSALVPLNGEVVRLCDRESGAPIPDTEIDLKRWAASDGVDDDSYLSVHYDFSAGGVGVSITIPPWDETTIDW